MRAAAQVETRSVVVGAGIAGLLAARVLADRFDEVVVVERDRLPAAPQPRRGVPQGRHPHVLLARGREVLEQTFPGFSQDVVGRDGLAGDLARHTRFFVEGGFLVGYTSGLTMLCLSRALLEAVVRDRVRQLGNVRFLESTEAVGLVADGRRVRGVRRRSSAGPSEQSVDGDLVVGATGRGGAPVRWLTELGYPAPAELRVPIRLTYVTRTFRRDAGDLGGALAVAINPDPPCARGAAALAREGDLWTVTLTGFFGERAPADLDGFRRYASSLPSLEVAELLERAEPQGEAAVVHFAASRRRVFEEARDLPEGYLVMGDALSSFNPIYGQGMTVACVESLALAAALDEGLTGVAPRFYRAAARAVDVPWALATGRDLRFPQVPGARTMRDRLLQAYVARLLVTAQHDRVPAQAFARTANLLDSPRSLLRPAVATRVLLGDHSSLLGARADGGAGGLPAEAAGRGEP